MRIFQTPSRVAAVLLATVAVIPSAVSAEDWLISIQNENCSDEAKQAVAESTRNKIEEAVRRAESAIQAPSPLGDLSCLSDLLEQNLTFFSSLGGIMDSLQSGLNSLDGTTLDIDVSGLVCSMAANKWATLTEALDVDSIQSLGAMSSTASDRMSGVQNAAYSAASGVLASSLVSALTGTEEAAGTNVSDYIAPDFSYYETNGITEVSYPSSIGYDGTADSSSSSAWDTYYRNLMVNLANYTACRVAGEIDGTTVSNSSNYGNSYTAYWNVPGAISDCQFVGAATPSYYSDSSATITTVEAVSDVLSNEVDRSAATAETTAKTGAGADTSTSTTSSSTIWDLVTNN